jgi:hypothetical protein
MYHARTHMRAGCRYARTHVDGREGAQPRACGCEHLLQEENGDEQTEKLATEARKVVDVCARVEQRQQCAHYRDPKERHRRPREEGNVVRLADGEHVAVHKHCGVSRPAGARTVTHC